MLTRQRLAALTVLTALAGCARAPSPTQTAGTVTITNRGVAETFPSPAKRLFVNDGNMISTVLALGAADQVSAISSLEHDAPMLRRHYGAALDRLKIAAPRQPALETVLAARPDVMVAGWGYSCSDATGLTPD